MIAAAEVNPLITSFDRKEAIMPVFKSTIIIWRRTTIKDSAMANKIYSSGLDRARAHSKVATSNKFIANGPTANCLEVPSIS